MKTQLLRFPPEDRGQFGFQSMVSCHCLHELDLFQDAALIDLLDHYPRSRLQVFTMGTDPCRREDWRYVDASGVSGKELLAAVYKGRLWVNLLRVELADARYAEVVAQLREELQEQCPRLQLYSINFATLIISSPEAMVYFHFDAPHQALWHIRGSKRIWLYRACDDRLAPQEVMEDIFVGAYAYDEEMSYLPSFDEQAVTFDLQAGDVVCWPHNAPHRVVNLGTLNVSLSTGFVTEDADRRFMIYAANRMLRRRLGVSKRSTREVGASAEIKCFAYRVSRRLGLTPKSVVKRPYHPTLRVDPEAPLGYREIAPEA